MILTPVILYFAFNFLCVISLLNVLLSGSLFSERVALDASISPLWSAVLDQFEPTSLPLIAEVVQYLQPGFCPINLIPSCLLKEVSLLFGIEAP